MKDSQTLRILCQNINGASPDNEGGKVDDMCKLAKETGADIIGITEHNLDTTQYQLRSLLYKTARKNFKPVRLAFGSSPTTMKGEFKAGGTMMLATGKSTMRYVGRHVDRMGRWSAISLRGRSERVITIITCYRPCQKSPNHFRKTAYDQQYVQLRLENKKNPDPIESFRKELSNFIKKCNRQKEDIILLGDFNEVLGSTNSGMTKLAHDCKLHDLMFYKHGTDQVKTYKRGERRLDYVLVSERIVHCVTRCGYLPFDMVVTSDHRAMYLDLNIRKLFGRLLDDMAPYHSRDVSSKHVNSVTTYLEAKNDYLERHNWYARCEALMESDVPDHDLVEQLDRDLTRASLQAAKKCAKIRREPYSGKLVQQRLLVNIYKKILSSFTTGVANQDQVQRDITHLENPYVELPINRKECQRLLRREQRKLRKLKKEATKHRREEQDAKIAAYEAAGDKKSAQRIRHIQKGEEIREMYVKLRSFFNPDSNKGITELEIPEDPDDNPKTCEKWRKLEIPSEIAQKLIDRNQKHFGQAHGTPFTIPPLSEDLQFDSDTPTADDILNGEYDLSQFDHTTQQLLRQLITDHDMQDALPYEITEEEFIAKFKVWDEQTTTSPSGMHLGHWKALVCRHSFSHQPATEECQELDSIQQKLRHAHLDIINYCLRFTYSLQRWRTVVTQMIPKEKDNIRIHRLRVIHLYEADYNMLLGLEYRRMIHHCEDRQVLHYGQYGSRAGRSAVDPVFVEELQTEIGRASRKCLIKFDNDATACYDRIIPSLAALTSRAHGMHRNVAILTARTLEEVRYKLKTQLGVSDEEYQHCDIYPIYGTGQGSGCSPGLWCIISSALFFCHDREAHGAVFESYDRTISQRMTMIGFVDDSAGQVNLFRLNTRPDSTTLISLMEQDAQLWNDLLWSSGGALELPKCSYFFETYQFARDGTPILRGDPVGPPLRLKSGDRTETQTIPFLHGFQSHKTLGHHKGPSGNQKQQKVKLQEKADRYASILCRAPLQRADAWTFYTAVYIPSMGYVLAQSHFTPGELASIQKSSMSWILARCGYNRHSPHEVMYGPSSLGGATFRELYEVQGEGQIFMFMKYWRKPDTLPGKLLRIAVSWAQAMAGTSTSILKDCTTRLPHVELKWLISLRDFLASSNLSLRLAQSYIVPLQRDNDRHLMDIFIRSRRYSDKQLRQLNYSRLFLQVHTVADLTTADGLHLDRALLHGRPNLFSSTSRDHHFLQEQPEGKAWELWIKASLLYSEDGQVETPLGEWTTTGDKLRRHWFAYTNTNNNSIYIRNSFYYEVYTPSQQSAVFVYDHIDPNLPENYVPVNVSHHPCGFQLASPPSYFRRSPTSQQHWFSLYEFTQSLPVWQRCHLEIQFLIDEEEALEILQTEHCIAAADGSLYEMQMSYGWILALENGRRLLRCRGPGFGPQPTPYRAEAYGVYSLHLFLHSFWKFYDVRPSLHIHCDCKSLVDKLNDTPNDSPNSTLSPEWDLLQSIRSYRRLLRTQLSHVLGHQDDKEDYHTLSLPSQLNVDAHHLANAYEPDSQLNYSDVPMMDGVHVQLLYRGKPLTRSYKSIIREAFSFEALKRYICDSHSWTEDVFNMVDWQSHGTVLQRRWHDYNHHVKLVHNLLPINGFLAKIDDDRDYRCPACHGPEETFDHLLRCPDSRHYRWRQAFLLGLRKECNRLELRPGLTDTLITCLRKWFNHQPILAIDQSPAYRALVAKQNGIGWIEIFRGRFACEWSQLQEEYLEFNHRDGNGTEQVIALISWIFDDWRKLWKIRTGEEHGASAAEQRQKEHERLCQQLDAYYEYRDQVLPRDRGIFWDDINEHKRHNNTDLFDWISLYGQFIQNSAKKAHKRAIQKTHTILRHFGHDEPHWRDARRRRSTSPDVKLKRKTRKKPPQEPPSNPITNFFARLSRPASRRKSAPPS